MKRFRAIMLVCSTLIATTTLLYPRSRFHRQRVRLAQAILEMDNPVGWKFWDFYDAAALFRHGLARKPDYTERVKTFLIIAESRELVMPWGADESVIEPMSRTWALTEKGREHFTRLAAA